MQDCSDRRNGGAKSLMELIQSSLTVTIALKGDNATFSVTELEKKFEGCEENLLFRNLPANINERILKAISAVYYARQGFTLFKDYDLGMSLINKERKELVFVTFTPWALTGNDCYVGAMRYNISGLPIDKLAE